MSSTSTEDLKKAYRTIMDDHFPPRMEVSFVDGEQRSTLVYEKVSWVIDGVDKGLRYGENPGQEAAMYKLVEGNLTVGEVTTIEPRRYLVSDMELLQSGKHPGKINLTDVDNALNILRYLVERPTVAILKHNNPCGVACADSLADAYHRANMADRVAAFGGAIGLNRPVDKPTAELIADNYAEVVAAPDFEEGTVEILARRKNLRILRIGNMARLADFAHARVVDFKSLVDGAVIAQTSFVPTVRSAAELLPAKTTRKGKDYTVERAPTAAELDDMIFGWMVEAGVTSNSVIYVKDGVTVGIGTGEQDRVGVAQIARDKAYTKLADRICWERHQTPMNLLEDGDERAAIEAEVAAQHGGLEGSVMISDAFFPFRDGVDVGLREGVSAILQPGGSINDYQAIEAVNERGATMMFTGQRSFKH
ncbi:MAG: IMP cyclohydrolase [Deltaproteobacteria bacterium]|nr:IMP cyclohydrolase [Deltaproteobacteria bacterium]MBW2530309.1 IMP cyclohydrolase [Deltaproteobacteria bacterium]